MGTTLPNSKIITTPQQVREYSHDLLRNTVLDATSRLLVQEGPDALTVRRIAQELRCSTKIIYTMFRSKDGLANALYLDGCERLRQALFNVSSSQAIETYLYQVGWAYWSFALANRSYYLVMFCGAIPNFTPAPESIQATSAVFDELVGILQQAIERGQLASNNAHFMAKSLWTALHGVVGLYFLGHIPTEDEAKEAFERNLRAVIASFR
ncbi:MAG TPA: TetR/AcrR family transcriptional regulator [Ktedonobacteraceae bacterium]|nr:TetR/AcrR family transcriptional regulator [Ktedonobacteraceae bacterium]